MAHSNEVLRSGGRLSVGFAVAAMLITLPALAADAQVAKNAFAYGGVRYYRGKAENVRLGSFGEKKTPISQANYLAVQDHIPTTNLAKVSVTIAGPYSIDWSKYSKTDVEATGTTKYVKAGGATATLSHEAAKSANLKLVKFYMNEAPLKTLLNSYAGSALKFLGDTGSDGRVVSEVWVVMEATLASQVTTSGSVTGSGTANGITVNFKASSTATTTTSITLPPDATFAYLLHKVKSWGSNKSSITDLEDDQHGPF